MAYIHGHAACIESGCPMFGVNQAECCDGEVQGQCVAATSTIAAAVRPVAPLPKRGDG
jgi:hypothetical protein